MALTRRVIRYLAFGVAVVVVAAVATVLVLTRTELGVERTGRFVLDRLEGSIHGRLTVDRITSGGLLEGVTLHGVTLTDEDDRPFLRADSARLGYRLSTLLRGSIVFERVTLYGPDVTIERLPGQTDWNYDRIFADSTEAPDTTATQGLILIRQAEIQDGRAIVRIPWQPDSPDADPGRALLEAVPGGTARVYRFEALNGRLPRVVWEAPGVDGRVVDIDGLRGRAYVWDSPLEVEELDGAVTIRDSVITFGAERVRLPASELTVAGQVVTGAGGNRYDVEAVGKDVALADFRWVYPRLPDDGGGSLRLRMQTQPTGELLWQVRDADVATRGSELRGSIGVLAGDPVRFTDVDLRLTPLDLGLLSEVLPDTVPLSGLVIGDVQADGPLARLRTRGDIRYRSFDELGEGAESSIRWAGVLGGTAPYAVRDMDVELRSVDLAQVAQFVPELAIRGRAQGRLRGNGSLTDRLQLRGNVALDHDGGRSVVRGGGWVALGDPPSFDLQLDLEPLSLELVAAQLPQLEGMRGEARGPVTVQGTPEDLSVEADVLTPAGGLVVRGGLALDGPAPRYRAEGSVAGFRLDRVAVGLPETVVTGRFNVQGAGFDAATMEGILTAEVDSAMVDGIDVYRAMARVRARDGLAQVHRFQVSTEVGDVEASGDIGLVANRRGQLQVNARADSLVFLEPLLFPDPTGELQRARVNGMVTVDGRVTGSLAKWRIGGTAQLESVVYDRFEVGTGRLDVNWRQDSVLVAATLDSVRYGHRELAGVRGTGTYTAGRGRVSADIRGRGPERLELETTFESQGEVVSLGLRRIRLASRDGQWTLADSAVAVVGRVGFAVDSLVLVRRPTDARIRVAGVLPWRPTEADEVQPASLDLDLDGVRIGEFLRVTQTDTVMDGQVTGRFRVDGTAMAPRLRGRVDVRSFRYDGATLDSVVAEVAYADEVLTGRFGGWQGRTSIVTGDARVPVRLVLTEEDDRLLDRPMDVTFRADGVPAELLAFLAPGFSGLAGRVGGRATLAGTTARPDLQGELRLVDGSARFEPLGVRYTDVRATARMLEGPGVAIDADLRTAAGRGRIQGTLDLTEPGDPALDLTVTARNLDAARRRDVTAVADGVAQVQGRYTRPVVSGDVTIVRGEMNLDEIWRQYQIVQLDTTLFRMMDTASISYRPEPENPFLENLQVTNTTLATSRNFWLRSRELNVEVGGTLALEVDRRAEAFQLTGTLRVVEGSYRLLARGVPGGRRFDIREGTIEFVGTPGIDPNLNIEAAYRVRRARGDPINVVAQVSGTLQDPRVELSSDAEVPLSETDLASYILFGRASAELTQAQLDVASGGALAVGLLRPAVTGVASTGLQQLLTGSLGLPVDYVGLSLPEYGFSEYGQALQDVGALGLLRNAQFELGFDPAPNVSVIGSVRFRATEAQESTLRLFGARVEYRPWQTFTIEGFIEDQFARTPSFGLSEIADRKVLGLSFFREWGY